MAYSAAESTISLYSVVSAKFTGPLFKIPTVLFYIEHLYNTLNLFFICNGNVFETAYGISKFDYAQRSLNCISNFYCEVLDLLRWNG